MKDFILGFLVCFFLGWVGVAVRDAAGLSPATQNVVYDEGAIRQSFEGIYRDGQGIEHRIETSSPTVSSLRNGEVIFTDFGGASSVFWRVGNSTFSVKGSKL